jgi:hypothetical protein
MLDALENLFLLKNNNLEKNKLYNNIVEEKKYPKNGQEEGEDDNDNPGQDENLPPGLHHLCCVIHSRKWSGRLRDSKKLAKWTPPFFDLERKVKHSVIQLEWNLFIMLRLYSHLPN